MTEQAKTNKTQLFKDMEAMRQDPNQAVVWALIRGRASAPRMALMLGWPSKLVEKKLNQAFDLGMMRPSTMVPSNWEFDPEHENFDLWKEMREVAVELEIEVVQTYANATIEPGYLSKAAQRQIDPQLVAEIKRRKPVYLLWPAQWANLQTIREQLGAEVFTTTDYNRARKTKRSEYSLNELKALAKKGVVEVVDRPHQKGQFWKLTELGLTYKHEPMTLGQKQEITSTATGIPVGAIRKTRDKLVSLLEENGAAGMTTQQIAEARGVSRSAIHRQMARLMDAGEVEREVMSDGSNRWFKK